MRDKDKDKGSASLPIQHVILNSTLTFIHSMMMSKDKSFIKEKTLAAFDWNALRRAHKCLFTTVNPDQHYGYNGPNQSDDITKANDAFEKIFSKMKKLDGEASSFAYACPSDELHLLPTCQIDVHDPCRSEFAKLHDDFDELKRTFHSFTGLLTRNQHTLSEVESTNTAVTNTVSMETASPVSSAVAPVSGINPQVRDRLDSIRAYRKKRKVSVDGDDSSSYVSCDEDAVPDNGFQPPTWVTKRDNRRNKGKEAQPMQNSPARPNSTKPQQQRGIVWGKSKSSNTSSFRGVIPRVPQVFVSKCNPDSKEEEVKEFLIAESIKVTSVKRINHQYTNYASFIVSVEKNEDYLKLISGNHIPEGVCARRYFNRVNHSEQPSNSGFTRQVADAVRQLDDVPSSVSTVSVGSTNSSQVSAQVSSDVSSQQTVTRNEVVSMETASSAQGSRNNTD